MKNIRKIVKLLSACICVGAFLASGMKANAKETFLSSNNFATDVLKTINECQIKKCVKDYFDIYENKNQKYTSSNELFQALKKRYSEKKSALKNLEVNKFFLDKEIAVEEESAVDLRECNKEIECVFSDLVITENTASVSVNVNQKWNYQFSPEIESGAEDNYRIEFALEKGIWKMVELRRIAGEDSTVKRLERFAENSILQKGNLVAETLAGNNSVYDASKAVKYANKYAQRRSFIAFVLVL